jgi:hypothetical protein
MELRSLRKNDDGSGQVRLSQKSIGERLWFSPLWEMFTGQPVEDSAGMGWRASCHLKKGRRLLRTTINRNAYPWTTTVAGLSRGV